MNATGIRVPSVPVDQHNPALIQVLQKEVVHLTHLITGYKSRLSNDTSKITSLQTRLRQQPAPAPRVIYRTHYVYVHPKHAINKLAGWEVQGIVGNRAVVKEPNGHVVIVRKGSYVNGVNVKSVSSKGVLTSRGVLHSK
jgi:hypothetical protein